MWNSIKVTPGDRYGRLRIVEEVESPVKGRRFFLCKCDCGNEKVIRLDHLRDGRVYSCGCSKKDKPGNFKHGMTALSGEYHRLYKIWSGMRNRCKNPKYKHFESYGGRGIKVCQKWDNDFTSFMDWAIENGYKEDLTIDRIDNNGDYEPSNCRWVNNKVQANNKRTNVLITYHGETHTISEWSDITGIAYWNIIQRHRVGLPLEQVFFDGDLRLIGGEK